MRHTRTTFAMCAAAAAALLAAGCGGAGMDSNARILIEPSSGLGKLALGLSADGAGLVAMGQISEKRRIMGMGVEIDVWVIKAKLPKKKADDVLPPAPKGTVVLIHPLMNGKYWFLGLGLLMSRRGYDVVLPDLRAHGSSGGEYVTWGVKEKHDIEMVMGALIAEGKVSDRIYVCGASLGGAVAIQYAAMDSRVRGVMAIAPPASLKRIGRRILPLASQQDYEDALWKAGAIAGFDPYSASAVEAAKRLGCPIILAHGLLDVIVPYTHSQAIYKAAYEPKKLITLPFQGHDGGLGQDLWIAAQLEKLPEMAKLPRRPRPQERVTPADIENFDEEAELEKIKRLEAIEKILKKSTKPKRGPKYE